jgi:hypothetical protein
MPTTDAASRRERLRNLLFLGRPALWPAWPFLPLMRRRPGRAEECGLLYDALHASGLAGLSATVFLGNLFALPPELEQFLALPRESFDTPEEVFAAGWRVD